MNKNTIVAIIATITALLSIGKVNAQERENLFNKKDLTNWAFVIDGNKVATEQVYSVKNEEIHIAGDPLGYMYTKKKYKDFHLHAEWAWPNGVESNSGIFVLIEDPKNPFPNGIECQLKAGDAGDFVLLGGSDLAEFKNIEGQPRPKFPVIKKHNASSEKTPGKWNEADIYCRDGIIKVYINGVFQNKGTNKIKEGHIGLQSEGKAIAFRNVTLTPLP